MKNGFIYSTSLGNIGIAEENGKICNVFFKGTVQPCNYTLKETPLLYHAYTQLEEYLSGTRRVFNLALSPTGTAFQQLVWAELLKIPYGTTFTYASIAKGLGKPTASRGVGSACGKNPISIFIPCHRVIGSTGKLTGYAGGIEMKKQLLLLEGVL